MAEEEQDISVDETGKSKKKLMIMISGGVVLLAIIVGAGLYFTGVFEGEKETVTAESADSEQDGSEENDTNSEAEMAVSIYHALTPPFMVNFSTGNIKIVKVAISLMAKDEQVIDEVEKHDPVIRNNILMLLSAQDPESLKTADGKALLQKGIKEEVNKVLTERKVPPKVEEVFFTDLVMQ
jgi:flagellar protein FliL